MALETGRSSKFGRSSLLSLAAMLMAAGIALPPAYAADLGGNCCADLEERVAELEATTARKGNRKMSLTISGTVQTSVMYWDVGGKVGGLGEKENLTGDASDVYIVDQVPGSSFQFAGSAKINPNLSAGFQLTIGINTGSRSHQVDQVDDDAQAGDNTIVMTYAHWYLDHKELGRLTVGRANFATAGITTIDLGGAGVIANANIGWWNAAFSASGAPHTWGDILGGATVNGSGTNRGNAITYTSPTFGGFSVQGAYGEDDKWDVALRYAGEFSGFRLAAGIGYVDNYNTLDEHIQDLPGSGDGKNQVKGSASILHVASGLFLTGAYVDQDNNNGTDNTTLLYAQGGIAKNWTGLGNTVLYGEYAEVDTPDSDVNGEATVWGLGVVQHIDAAAMELYVSYRNYSSNDEAHPTSTDDMNIVVGGARVRF